jgi:DNA invertase Pin-like site-specific DNA recombinase
VSVWKLDRLGRSLKDLIETLNLLKERGVDFISLTEHIDTTTPGGKLIFHLMGALAEFERDLIRERTNAGLAAARARGHVGGRPRKLATNGKVALAQRLFADKKHSIDDICSTLGISRSTLPLCQRGKEGIRSARIIIQKSPTESWDLHILRGSTNVDCEAILAT